MATLISPQGLRRAWTPTLGAWPDGDGTRFRVWAAAAQSVEVVVERPGSEPLVTALQSQDDGMFVGHLRGVHNGDRYRYRVDGRGPFPDPVSRYQPDGVHGPSQVVDPTRFLWSDQGWGGLSPQSLVIYELHVGTFSPEGTFEGVTKRLSYLRDLGVTAIELMPVADFAGCRNWGYDGVALFAPARCYGTPDDLRRLVDEAHRLGLGVILDVVYNHFGPSGNYTREFSKQYVTGRENAWSACVNLDEEGCQHVREFFIENTLHWMHEFHIDGLRLDAADQLNDETAPHFLQELATRVHEAVAHRWSPLIAEDHRNLNTVIRPREQAGWGLDGVWADDFHHQLRRVLTGDDEGYYADYSGTAADLATTINQGWLYTGQYFKFWGQVRGTKPPAVEPWRFVYTMQNHDQVGNRPFGDRLNAVIDLARYRAATALLLTVPQTPLLFMGQEWAASTPFRFFTDHEEELGRLVTQGRRKEFCHYRGFADPEVCETIPDPQALATFESSKLDWSETGRPPHASMLALYRTLLHLRRTEPALQCSESGTYQASALDDDTVLLRRDGLGGARLLVIARLRGSGRVELPAGRWQQILSTEDPLFTTDAAPPEVDTSGAVPFIQFYRPGAVILKATCGDNGRESNG